MSSKGLDVFCQVNAVGKLTDVNALPSADMVSCVSVDLLEVTASGEMTQHYSAYVSFSGSLPCPREAVVVSLLNTQDRYPTYLRSSQVYCSILETLKAAECVFLLYVCVIYKV